MATNRLGARDDEVTDPFCRTSAHDRAAHGWSLALTSVVFCRTSAHDRAVQGWSLALTSVVVGAIAGLIAVFGEDVIVWIAPAMAAVTFGDAWWRERATDTQPRHARRAESIGAGSSCLLLVGFGLPFVYFDATPLSPAGAVVLGAFVAAPAVVAGWLIGRRPRAGAPRNTTEPRLEFDAEDADQVRSRIMAALSTVDEAERAVVHRAVPVRGSMLTDQIRALEDAGDIRVRRWFIRTHPRTWLRLTSTGRAKAVREVELLTG